MEVINIQKHYVKSIENYKSGFIIELENWVNPETVLRDINQNSNSNYTIGNCIIQCKMSPKNEISYTLYATIDKIDF